MLESTVVEIEAHVHAAGWDRGPLLFALVPTLEVIADDPESARRLGLSGAVEHRDPDALTAIEQEPLADDPLDELLGSIAWPGSVTGAALSQEIVILPPSAEAELAPEEIVGRAAEHPARREARLVVGVLRDGSSAALLRMRGRGDDDELLTGPDLAPNLVAALLATFDA